MRAILARCVFGTALCVTVPISSQDRIPLTIAETHEAPVLVGAATFPAKCGPDNAVYVRFFDGQSQPPTRISADANSVTTFGLDGTRYYQHANIWDFAPAPDGGTYEVIFYRIKGAGEGYRLLTFEKSGRLQHDVALDIAFDAQHLAVFGNGNLLVEGRKRTTMGGHTGAPAIAILDESGRVVKNLTLEGDVKSPKLDDKSSQAAEAAQEDYNRSINLSTAIAADDGKIYVLRRSPTGPLFAISPDGSVRTINLPKYENAWINVALVNSGRLLIHYIRVEKLDGGTRNTSAGFYAIYDIATMNKLLEYGLEPLSPLRGSIPVCYSVDQLSFLRVNGKRHPVLLVTRPE